MSKRKYTFVAAVNNRAVLQDNLLSSPCLRVANAHELLIQEGYRSAGKAYNEAMARSQNDYLIFLHQDVILPEAWMQELEASLDFLESQDPKWGVLGCFGKTQDGGGRGYVYQAGPGIIGAPFDRPERVQSLDEIVLILRKSSGLRFDESLPNYHLYGTDICLRAGQLGRNSYAIPAFCIHNSNQGFILPQEFYDCYWHIRRNWREQLPVQASCIRITKWNVAMYRRRLLEIYFRYRRPSVCAGLRTNDVKKLVQEANRTLARKSAAHCAG